MKIYGNARSGNCLKVSYTADYLGLPYEWIEIDIVEGESRARRSCAHLDDTRLMEVVGVAQALGALRSSLDGIDELLNERRFEEASQRGYGDVSSNFIFLQRTLAGLQAAEFEKHALVQEVARKAKLSYKHAAPFVECKLKTSVPRDPAQAPISREEVKKRLRERYGHLQVSDEKTDKR